MADDTVHIVGGGIAGLALALGLLRGGRSVRVYERVSQLGEVGAGLSISPNASHGLDYLDMLDFMEAQSNKPQTNYVRHWQTNEELVGIDRTTDMDRFGAKYYQIHRADFHSQLESRVRALDPDCILLDHALAAVAKSDVETELTFENGVSVRAACVIGADGIRSAARDCVFENCEPAFTGLMAWRGLIPAQEVAAKYSEPVSRVWTGPGRTFVTYPIRNSQLVNFVAFGQAPGWTEEGWSVPASPEELFEAFADYCEPVRELIDAAPHDTLFRWGLFAREPLKCLTSGNIALIGDAAHPMLPWFGQGASSAIEDAVVLCRCLLANPQVSDALEQYNKSRYGRVSFLQKESNLGTERMQGFDPYLLRDAPRRDEDALGIFKYDPATVELA